MRKQKQLLTRFIGFSLFTASIFFMAGCASETQTPLGYNSDSSSVDTPPKSSEKTLKKRSTPVVTPSAKQDAPITDFSGNNKEKVDVFIVDMSFSANNKNLIVYAQINKISPSNGACKVTVSQEGQTSVSATSKALPDAQTSYCDNLNVTLPPNASGEWKAEFFYSDNTHAGSDEQTFMAQ